MQVMDSKEKNMFMEAIESGKEIRRYVRIQVIGEHGVGKSTLVRRLLGQDIKGVKSTDGIEIDNRCQIRKSNGEWIVGKAVGTERNEMIRRIRHAVYMKRNPEMPDTPLQNDRYLVETDHVDSEKLNTEHEVNMKLDIPFTHKLPQIKENTSVTKTRLVVSSFSNKDFQNEDSSVEIEKNTNEQEQDPTIENEFESGKKHQIPRSSKEHKQEAEANNYDENLNGETHDKTSRQENQTNTFSKINDEETRMSEGMDEIFLEVKKISEKITTEDLIECRMWDFAGEKDYYVTHQTFLTPHAIYLLVANVNDEIKQVDMLERDTEFDSIAGYIDFWFDSIHCFCENPLVDKLKPPVIMVLTHTDKCKQDESIQYKTKFDTIIGSQTKGGHKRSIHFISNTESVQEEIEKLKKKISDVAAEMNYFAEELPMNWIQLERVLAISRDLGEYILPWENMKELACRTSIKEEELLDFLNYQHQIGNIIFFKDISDYIILKPEWLVKCFRCLVFDANVDKTVNDVFKLLDWNKLINTGELSEKMIDQLFEKDNIGRYKNHLLNVMEKFDIIIKPKFRGPYNIESQVSNAYYMPCMIKAAPTTLKDIVDKFCGYEDAVFSKTPWLILEFEFLPLAYFNHILFNFIRNYAVCDEFDGDKQKAIYRGKAVFFLDQQRFNKFIICFSKNSLSLQIWNWSKVGDETYRHVLEELCDIIRELNKKLSHNISYVIKAKCHDGDYSKVADRIRYEELTTRCGDGLYMCEEHRKTHTKNDIEETWLKHVDTLYWPDTMSESRHKIYKVNYMRPESAKQLVAAIDIGNTYSGYAFSFGNEFVNNPCNIARIGWIPASTNLITSKTPTSILLNQNQKFEAFGYEADDRYQALVDEDLHHGWYYFKRFKMNLIGSMGLKRDQMLKTDDNKMELPALTILSMAIEYLKRHLLDTINKRWRFDNYQTNDIQWVFTVPSIWNNSARQFMREAIEQAGINREQIVIVLEPEAASLFYKFKSVEREKSILQSFQPGRRYIILDCGGATVNISAHNMQSDKTLKELYKANGQACGGIQVEEAFKNLIIKIVSKEIFSKFSTCNTSDYVELFREFEIKKRVCNRKATETVTIKIPVSLKETFEKESKETIQNVISQSQYSSKLKLDSNKLRVNNILFASLFEGVTARIVEFVKKFLKGPDVSETSSIIMVGGFSESQLLQAKIKKAFPNVRVIIPRDAELAVLTGAVIFGHLS